MNINRKTLYLVMVLFTLCWSLTILASDKVLIEGVPSINQKPELPTGCEATALTMVLNYYGVNVTKEEVATAMPKAPRPTFRNGQLYGESAYNAFIGDPFSSSGFGVFSPVIYDLVENYLPGRAEDLGGGSFDTIYKAIDEGRPVVAWVTINMAPSAFNSSWITPTGERFTWRTPEHAVTVVGYDSQSIYVNDPYTGKQTTYDKATFVKRWEEMGRQAVAVKKESAPAEVLQPAKVLTSKDAVVNDIIYSDLIVSDGETEWISMRTVQGLHWNTKVGYDTSLNQPTLTIKEDYPIPSDTSKWIASDSMGRTVYAPRNVNGEYYVHIKLASDEDEVVTYNPKGRKVILRYDIMDGTTYVTRQWVETFYELDIRIIE